jgi:hypothetical protein
MVHFPVATFVTSLVVIGCLRHRLLLSGRPPMTKTGVYWYQRRFGSGASVMAVSVANCPGTWVSALCGSKSWRLGRIDGMDLTAGHQPLDWPYDVEYLLKFMDPARTRLDCDLYNRP